MRYRRKPGDFFFHSEALRDEADPFDAFVEETNDVLVDAGFGPLYARNPYDWIFLFCAAEYPDESGVGLAGQPNLDRFQNILSDAFPEDDEA